MLRSLAIFLAGGIVGTAFGVGVGFFAFPFVFPPPPAAEMLRAEQAENRVATGTFLHADPDDPIHWGQGGVEVFETAVFLKQDFKVGPGPAYHVYLVPAEAIRGNDRVPGTMFVDLGRLRAFEGSQVYDIPAGVDLTEFPSVVIWCARFDVLISPADLNFDGAP